MLVIGIDPGNLGGIGVITDKGNFYTAFKMPDKFSLEAMLRDTIKDNEFFFCIEKSFPSHNQGITSIFSHGFNYGVYIKTIRNLCTGLYAQEFIEVLPQKWKKSFSLSKDKKKSMELCLRLFPESKTYIYGSRGGAYDGVAEGLLLAEYGRQYLKRQLIKRRI